MKTFSIKEAIYVGWDKVWKNLGVVVFAVLISFVIGMLFGFIGGMFEENSMPEFGITILSTLVNIFLSIGIMKIYFKVHDGVPTSVSEIFSHANLFWKYLGTSILMMILIGLGLILFIIPGIYLAIRFSFANLLVVDKEVGPLEALKQSSELTVGIKGQIILFLLALAGINILGFLALGIGLLITTPLSAIATIHVYRSLLGAKTAASQFEQTPVATI